MRYSVETYDKTENDIKNRQSIALDIHRQRMAEIRQKAPEIGKLCDVISQTSSKLTSAVISGGKDTARLISEIRDSNLKAQETIRTLLVEFGYDADYLNVPYTCPVCKDTGSVNGRKCQCFMELVRKNAVAELRSKSNIELRDFSEFRLDYYPDTPFKGASVREQMRRVYDYCVDYACNFSESSPSLLFIGNTGLGKTFLSSAMAKKITENGFSVVLDSIHDLLRKVENEHFGRSDENTMELILEADLVILDDLGSEFISNFNSSSLYNIINDRMNSGRPIIISTNFSIKELDEKYNDRIISRISSFIPIRFEGNDIRQVILKSR